MSKKYYIIRCFCLENVLFTPIPPSPLDIGIEYGEFRDMKCDWIGKEEKYMKTKWLEKEWKCDVKVVFVGP